MTTFDALFGGVLVLILFVVAAWTIRLQLRRLHETALDDQSEEIEHIRRRAGRRLVCGLLMALLGVMLAGALFFLEAPAQELADQGPIVAEKPENRPFARLYGWYWASFLLLLMTMVLLAGWDFLVEWRYGRGQMRRLQEERRAMVARETELMRQQKRRTL